MIQIDETKLREVLDALSSIDVMGYEDESAMEDVKSTLRSMMEQKPLEPVAWMNHDDEPMIFPDYKEAVTYCDDDETPIPLYTLEASDMIDLKG